MNSEISKCMQNNGNKKRSYCLLLIGKQVKCGYRKRNVNFKQRAKKKKEQVRT